jgi:hypothetical protein
MRTVRDWLSKAPFKCAYVEGRDDQGVGIVTFDGDHDLTITVDRQKGTLTANLRGSPAVVIREGGAPAQPQPSNPGSLSTAAALCEWMHQITALERCGGINYVAHHSQVHLLDHRSEGPFFWNGATTRKRHFEELAADEELLAIEEARLYDIGMRLQHAACRKFLRGRRAPAVCSPCFGLEVRLKTNLADQQQQLAASQAAAVALGRSVSTTITPLAEARRLVREVLLDNKGQPLLALHEALSTDQAVAGLRRAPHIFAEYAPTLQGGTDEWSLRVAWSVTPIAANGRTIKTRYLCEKIRATSWMPCCGFPYNPIQLVVHINDPPGGLAQHGILSATGSSSASDGLPMMVVTDMNGVLLCHSM